jgi:Rrf2 family protein
MNLDLSKRGDYVVRSAICLARSYESGTPKKLRQVSLEMGIPRTYVSQILGDLVRAGLAQSFFGTNGGHRLARSPDTVSLLEVVEAAEGPLAPDACVLGEGPCRWESVCPLHETWGSAAAALRTVLAETTLAELVERDRAIEAGSYSISGDSHRHHDATVAVTDSVQVELSASAVAQKLRSKNSWLVPHVEAAHAENEAILVRIGPGGPLWLGKVVAVHLGIPEGPDEHLVIPVTWEATGPSGLFPRFNGDLGVTSVDPDRTELTLSGRYRPPLGRAGHAIDDALMARVAHATIRSLLRRMARALEEDSIEKPAGGP